jgi:cbb3-type cytochrome oxidase cytochrome c subunit
LRLTSNDELDIVAAAKSDFAGHAGHITKADALIAYLQMLGTLVDFTLAGNMPRLPAGHRAALPR